MKNPGYELLSRYALTQNSSDEPWLPPLDSDIDSDNRDRWNFSLNYEYSAKHSLATNC